MSRDGVVSKFTHGFETKRDRCRVHGSGEGVSLSTGTGLTQFVLTLAVITAIREQVGGVVEAMTYQYFQLPKCKFSHSLSSFS